MKQVSEILETMNLPECSTPDSWEAEQERKAIKEWHRQREEDSKHRRVKRIEELFKSSNLGRRFIDRTFNNFKQTDLNSQAYKMSHNYAINFPEYASKGEGLILTGTVGTGKTHLAASVANYLISNAVPVLFGNITGLLGRIKDTYSGDGKEKEILDSLMTADLLIIDDLGKEQKTDWVTEKLYSIINVRYEDYKPIMITTNLSMRDIEKQLGEATFSRLIEMSTAVQMNGTDYRKKKLGQP